MRWRRAADLLVAFVLTANLVFVLLQLVPGERLEVAPATGPEFLWLTAASLAPAVVARRLVQQRTVTFQTLLGAVAAHLQIAVAFAFAFQVLDTTSALPLFGVQVPTTSYMYASLTALSTLGYGDLVPVTELGRLFGRLGGDCRPGVPRHPRGNARVQVRLQASLSAGRRARHGSIAGRRPRLSKPRDTTGHSVLAEAPLDPLAQRGLHHDPPRTRRAPA